MARAFLITKFYPPDSIVESADIQKAGSMVTPGLTADSRLTLKCGQLWLCAQSMEITLTSRPSSTPTGFLKALHILRKSIG